MGARERSGRARVLRRLARGTPPAQRRGTRARGAPRRARRRDERPGRKHHPRPGRRQASGFGRARSAESDRHDAHLPECLRGRLFARYGWPTPRHAMPREEPHMIRSDFAGLTCMTAGLFGVTTD
ncbi:hypothetical protein E3O65_14975 [Cryobacterium breve]|uniref:Uncharacterized protein n=1 Tax=Cryobacterium breve TaxID=1259258 RepID=A0ABY2IYC1_9MICO|nr:hypothetical protein E3T20_09765 [Cryobacterium sp. TmT3-12]TFC95351.1 hypothetical protein E3O65_14975 [Cryobacterium breve]